MPILLSAQEIGKTFAARPLFDSLSFGIETGERIGLIGPNGAGKSTLLSILAGKVSPDSGKLSLQRGLRIGFLEQVPSFSPGATVESTVMEGAQNPDDWEDIARAGELMARLDLSGNAAGIGPETKIESLSGGWKKRAALARELLREPQLLLLDEPTNHLDIESIAWLEDFLAMAPFAAVTITHDRAFLQRIANRILELDRRNPGGLLSIPGDYTTYLETKASVLAAQASQETKLRNTLRRETEWLRQGAKARTTKQQARIQRAEALQDTVSELGYRNQVSTVRMEALETGRSPKKLIEAVDISKKYNGREILPHMDLLVTPKSRIGLLGANGVGKSTLIRLLLKLEESDTGTVTHAEVVRPAYFEQNRESLDPELTVKETICPLGDQLDYNDRRIHVRTYLERFLFTGNQVDMPVGRLSGGEQSRLLLARLFLEPANVLVLDEPTNDLDMTTLDVLEDILREFQGAVILVTHDRYFLDQVATQIVALAPDHSGTRRVTTFANLAQWEAWREREEAERIRREKAAKADAAAKKSNAGGDSGKKRKLSFKEQRELDGMEAAIGAAEAKLGALEAESADPEIASHASRLLEITEEMTATQTEIERLYARWAELSS